MTNTLTGVLRDRFSLGLIAVGAIAAGMIMLYWPVHLDAYDKWGFRIQCGSGYAADFDQAGAPTDSADLDACRAAIWSRRAWAALPLSAGIASAGLALYRMRRP